MQNGGIPRDLMWHGHPMHYYIGLVVKRGPRLLLHAKNQEPNLSRGKPAWPCLKELLALVGKGNTMSMHKDLIDFGKNYVGQVCQVSLGNCGCD